MGSDFTLLPLQELQTQRSSRSFGISKLVPNCPGQRDEVTPGKSLCHQTEGRAQLPKHQRFNYQTAKSALGEPCAGPGVCVGWQRGFRRFQRRSQTSPKPLERGMNTPRMKPQMFEQKDQQNHRDTTFLGCLGQGRAFSSQSKKMPLEGFANPAAHQSRAIKGFYYNRVL